MTQPLFYPGAIPTLQYVADPDVPESNPQELPNFFNGEFLPTVASRWVYTYSSAAERDANLFPSAGVTYFAYTRDTSTLWVSTSSTWVRLAVAGGAPWSAYTPAWTNSDGTALSYGNGQISGRYELTGKTLRAAFSMIRGTSTDRGGTTQTYYWSLPPGVSLKNSNQVNGNAVIRQYNGNTNSTMYEATGTVVGITSTAIAVSLNSGSRLGAGYKVSAAVTGGWSPGDIVSWSMEAETN